MNTSFTRRLILTAILFVVPCSIVQAQSVFDTPPASQSNSTTPNLESQDSNNGSLNAPIIKEKNWYASWGYSRQQYAPSDIHITQPGLGNNYTVHQATAQDFPANPGQTLQSIASLNLTTPQENIRIGRYLNAEKTFAIELNLDHSKFNTNIGQTAYVSGVAPNGIGGQKINQNVVLNAQTFDYELHNGLNHIMVNGVWLHHLFGPEQKPGDMQLISRAGAGILLPHSEITVDGQGANTGPKDQNICCFSSNDWWQVNGWTAGVEIGGRYRITESMYLELTAKEAYGVLHHVPVYQGTADQSLWMTEEVLSAGFLF